MVIQYENLPTDFTDEAFLEGSQPWCDPPCGIGQGLKKLLPKAA